MSIAVVDGIPLAYERLIKQKNFSPSTQLNTTIKRTSAVGKLSYQEVKDYLVLGAWLQGLYMVPCVGTINVNVSRRKLAVIGYVQVWAIADRFIIEDLANDLESAVGPYRLNYPLVEFNIHCTCAPIARSSTLSVQKQPPKK